MAKQGAIYHGLATLLQQPSPVMSRGNAAGPQHVPSSTNPPETSTNTNGASTSAQYNERLVDWNQSPGAPL